MIYIIIALRLTIGIDLYIWRSVIGDVTNQWTHPGGRSESDIEVVIRDSGSSIHLGLSMDPVGSRKYTCITKGVRMRIMLVGLLWWIIPIWPPECSFSLYPVCFQCIWVKVIKQIQSYLNMCWFAVLRSSISACVSILQQKMNTTAKYS